MHPFSSEAHQNFEPNYEAIAGIIDSLCKSYAPKKKSSASGEFGVYIDDRLGTRVVWIGSFD